MNIALFHLHKSGPALVPVPSGESAFQMMTENINARSKLRITRISLDSINLLSQDAAPGVETCVPHTQTSWASLWVIQLMFSSLLIHYFNRLLMRGWPILYSEVIIGIVGRMHSGCLDDIGCCPLSKAPLSLLV